VNDQTTNDGSGSTEAARRTLPAISAVPSNFMLDADTYAAAATVGYAGMDFYFAGRAGVLGDVGADVVVRELEVFPEAAVSAAWEATSAIEPRFAAGQRFADQAARWADEHLDPDALDHDRLSELAGKVLDAADLSDAALVQGWLTLDEPASPAARALHRLNGLRELRFARHRVELTAAGIDPLDAVMVSSPFMAGIFGWPEPHPDPDQEVRDRWALVEAATDERFSRDLAALDAAELAEFVDLCESLPAAVR
jgi:hypothetical protein